MDISRLPGRPGGEACVICGAKLRKIARNTFHFTKKKVINTPCFGALSRSFGHIGEGHTQGRGEQTAQKAISVFGTDVPDGLAETETVILGHTARFEIFERVGKKPVCLFGELVVDESRFSHVAQLYHGLGHKLSHRLVTGLEPDKFAYCGPYLAHPRGWTPTLDTIDLLVDELLVFVEFLVNVRCGIEIEQFLGLTASGIYVHQELAQLRSIKIGYGLAESEL